VGTSAHARGAEVVSKLDSNDTRMQQVTFANGKIWGALDTAVSFDTTPAHNKAGVAWYIVKPDVTTGTIAATIGLQGISGVPGKNIIYPAIGVTASGRGVVALTLSGPDNFPSAAYAAIDAQVGMGAVTVIADGAATTARPRSTATPSGSRASTSLSPATTRTGADPSSPAEPATTFSVRVAGRHTGPASARPSPTG